MEAEDHTLAALRAAHDLAEQTAALIALEKLKLRVIAAMRKSPIENLNGDDG